MPIRPARRSAAKPLMGIYAQSGTGKTMSALYLARGFVGPGGKIGMVETEQGRGEAYADMIPGGYDVVPLTDNFSPQAYGGAIGELEAAKVDAMIIDSGSHEWEGIGGVLDMADKNKSGGKKGLQVWQKPKMDHQKHFIARILQSPIPLIILCLRGKFPMEEGIDNRGKKTLVRSKDLVPKQDGDLLYEMFIHGWIDHDHCWHATKVNRPELRQVIPDGRPISIETGERLAAWARGDETTPADPGTPGGIVGDLLGSIDATDDPAALEALGAQIAGMTLTPKDRETVKAAYVARRLLIS